MAPKNTKDKQEVTSFPIVKMEDTSSAPTTPVCTGETDIDTENENEAVEVAEEQPSTSGVQEHDDPN